MKLSARDLDRIERWRTNPVGMRVEQRAREAERITDRRLWSVLMLARDVHVAHSILVGRPVLVGCLDPVALLRALRGQRLPLRRDSYFRVRAGHLDAVAEGGPITPNRRGGVT